MRLCGCSLLVYRQRQIFNGRAEIAAGITLLSGHEQDQSNNIPAPTAN